MAIKVIARDPFARHDIIREEVKDLTGGCDYCGCLSAKGNLFRYGVEPDAIRIQQHWLKGKFCSIGCKKSYHS